ncbi:MAG: GGDEF domain-containing protein [Vicinamibacterales bacterium]
MSDGIVALNLHQSPLSTALTHLERLLDLIGSALADPDDTPARDALQSRIADYRQALSAQSAPVIRERGEALLSACSMAIESHGRLRAARRAEIADMVTLFRDMTMSLTGEGTALTSEMTSSAARFAALGNISDIRLLKDRLGREVSRLKETAQAREEKWQQVVHSFQDRVETLETQLLATKQEASLDPLTGVANRRLFDQSLQAYMKEGSRRFALVLVDVDDFKKINDRLGHEAGDRALQMIAHSFATSVRSDDMVARLGGDEFALLLENVTLAQATSRVIGIVATLMATESADGSEPVTVSCGVAEFSAGDTAQSLSKRADEALYDAKRQGKGRVVQKSAPLIRDLRKR